MSHFLGQTKNRVHGHSLFSFQQQIFIAKILEMIFVIKPLFYTLVLFKYSTPEIKGPTPRCQAWLIYIYCKHPKHWFEWLCRFAREILDTLRGKLKTWIGKKNLAPKRMSSKQCCGVRDSKLINLRCQEMIGHPNLTTSLSLKFPSFTTVVAHTLHICSI